MMPTITHKTEQLLDSVRASIGSRTFERFNNISADVRRNRNADSAASAALSEAIGDKHSCERESGFDTQRWHNARQEMPEEVRAAHEHKIAAASSNVERALSDVARVSKKFIASRDTLEAATSYLNDYAAAAPLPEVAESSPTRSKDFKAQLVAATVAKEASLNLRERTSKARQGQDADEATFISEELDPLLGQPDFTIEMVGGRAKLSFPSHVVEAESNSGNVPYAHDPRPAYVRAHRDEIISAARSAISDYYLFSDFLVMTPEEKRKRLHELDEAILAHDRTIACIVWTARSEGEELAFPKGTDIRAVLGVEGPPPRRG